METYTHKCSCGESYTDNDPDVYFCPSCVEQRKIVARQVDSKMINIRLRPRAKTDLELMEEKGKTMPSARGGFATFIKASDLGL